MTCAVVHAGALGDSILVWPLVRAAAQRGSDVLFVASASHAQLGAAEIGRQLGTLARGGQARVGRVKGVSADAPLWRWMWGGEGPPPEGEPLERVYTAVADDQSAAGRTWLERCTRACAPATVIQVGPQGSAQRDRLWRQERVEECGGVEPLENDRGAAVLWVGAGGEAKRWPLERWLELRGRLQAHEPRCEVHLLAGPVERERLSAPERRVFESATERGRPGRFCDDPQSLADALRSARLVVCADSGPAHLAAQLGVRTLALFGPTDPAVWRPIGPQVRTLAPPAPTQDMAWLGADTVCAFLVSQQWLR